MRIGISTNLAAIGIFLASNPVFAAPPDDGSGTAAKVPFHLSAELGDRMQLSRNEINPGSVVKMQQPTPAAPAISYAGSPFADPYGTKSNSQAAEDPRAYLMETNVNWAGWVGQFADRWYYVLRQYEEGAGAQFVTERPALFQFTLCANGQIANVRLMQSSGNVIYDNLQMIALMQTAPLPPFPAGTKRSSITLTQGWESHIKRPGEQTYIPGSYGKNFPTEKVREWVMQK